MTRNQYVGPKWSFWKLCSTPCTAYIIIFCIDHKAFWAQHRYITGGQFNPYNAELFCINHGDQRVFFKFKVIINVLVISF